jgi:C4-dicarboxylate transporter DctM subunit
MTELWLSVAFMVLLVLAGVPVFLSIFVAVAIISVTVMNVDATVLVGVMNTSVSKTLLIAVPLFILSGQLLARSGALTPLARLLTSFMGHIPGGPAYAVIIACVAFAAMSSTGMAGVAGFAPVIVPLMTGMGYSLSFTIGLLICASSLAGLIPPAIFPIYYGYISDSSVLALWTAGIMPGLMIAFFLGIIVFIQTRRGHYVKLPRASWRERFQAVKGCWPLLLMPAAVLGPLYGGYATPTEVAAIATVYSLLLGTVFFRQITPRLFWDACLGTASITARIFVIIMAALLLNAAFVYVRLPYDMADWLGGLGLNWVALMAIVAVAFLLMGAFLDPVAIVLIAVPLLLPTLTDAGVNVISFGVFTAIAVEMAIITPPYGMALFAATGILNQPLTFIARSCMMFYPAIVLGMILVAYVPQLTTWLPSLLGQI